MPRFEQTVASIGPLDSPAMQQARDRQDRLAKPARSLGRLEELSVQLAGITGTLAPALQQKAVIVMVGDHGVAAQGVSAYPSEVTRQMVLNFLQGGAAISVLARLMGARVVVVDVGVAADLAPHPGLINKKVAKGTRDFTTQPAMSRLEAEQAIEVGIAVVEQEAARGLDLVAAGEMGIGNTTASSALVATLTGESPELVTGRGTGVSDQVWEHKVRVVHKALAQHRPDARDPVDVLAKVGGLEIGGLVGVMLGAAARRVPVVVDGFISGAAALVAAGICPSVKDYLIASHRSAERGHGVALRWLGLEPPLDLGLRLGEGTGALLAFPLIEAAVKLLNEMATFQDAGVSEAVEEQGTR